MDVERIIADGADIAVDKVEGGGLYEYLGLITCARVVGDS